MNQPRLSVFESIRAWSDTGPDFQSRDLEAVAKACQRGALALAFPSEVQRFESKFAEFTGAKYAVAFCNGTAALHAALWASGVGPGDEVLMADYGFHGMAAPVLALGGRVVPCDIDPDSLCLDPGEIESAKSPATKAVLVHNPWGMPADWDELRAAARRNGLRLISDASHAHGALYKGRPLGELADITCYSLGIKKLISGGELGCAVTHSAELRDRMLICAHVNRVPEDLVVIPWIGNAVGLKGRPHPLATVLALQQIERFPERILRLRQTCRDLEQRFIQCGFAIQSTAWPVDRVYWRLMLRVDDKNWTDISATKLERTLRSAGLPVEPNPYWPTLQNQRIFQWADNMKGLRRRPCPRTQEITPRLLTLPSPFHMEASFLEQFFVTLSEKLLPYRRSGKSRCI